MGSVSLKPEEHNNFSKQRKMQPEAGQPLPLPLPQRGPQQPWLSQRMPVICRLAGGDAGPGLCSSAGLPLLSASLKDAGWEGFSGYGASGGRGRCRENLAKALCEHYNCTFSNPLCSPVDGGY